MEFTVSNLNIYQKLQDFKAKLHFINFINNPTNTEGIFKMTQSFQNSAPKELIERVMSPVLEKSQLREDFEAKRWYPHPNMKILSQYAPETFGFHVADFFEKNNLDENLFPKADYSSIPNYITSRVYQTHDFWHVLTGYSVKLMDELALQAFAIGQYRQPLSLLIIAGGIIHLLQKHPDKSTEIMNSIFEGYERGQQSEFLLDKNIFQYLDQPIVDVQSHFKIYPRGQSLVKKI